MNIRTFEIIGFMELRMKKIKLPEENLNIIFSDRFNVPIKPTMDKAFHILRAPIICNQRFADNKYQQ